MEGLPPLPLDPEKNPLTLEQQFLVAQWGTECQKMMPKDLLELSIVLYAELLRRDNYYRKLIKKDWGL